MAASGNWEASPIYLPRWDATTHVPSPPHHTSHFLLAPHEEACAFTVVLLWPLVQGMILGTGDRVPYRAPCVEPASPSACVSASLCFSHK